MDDDDDDLEPTTDHQSKNKADTDWARNILISAGLRPRHPPDGKLCYPDEETD